MKLREELSRERQRWSASTFYARFERIVVYVLTALIALVIAMATWELALTVLALITSNQLNPANFEVFQAVFGAVFTVLIALEFKNSLLVTLHARESIVQVRSVVLIALLALVRKFIIIDVNTVGATMLASIAAATVSLGLVYRLVRDPNHREKPVSATAEAGDQDHD
jgi:uncharacterized membrane protein (DUF373 family)